MLLDALENTANQSLIDSLNYLNHIYEYSIQWTRDCVDLNTKHESSNLLFGLRKPSTRSNMYHRNLKNFSRIQNLLQFSSKATTSKTEIEREDVNLVESNPRENIIEQENFVQEHEQNIITENKRRSSVELNIVNSPQITLSSSPRKISSFQPMNYTEEIDPITPLGKIESFLEKNVLEIIESETGKPYNSAIRQQSMQEYEETEAQQAEDETMDTNLQSDDVATETVEIPQPEQSNTAQPMEEETHLVEEEKAKPDTVKSNTTTSKFTSLISSIKSFVTGKLSPSPATTTTSHRLSKVTKQNKTQSVQSLKAAEIARKKEEEKKKKLDEKKKQNEEKKKANQAAKQKQIKSVTSTTVDKKAMLKEKLEKAKQSKATVPTTNNSKTTQNNNNTSITNIPPPSAVTPINPFATPSSNKNLRTSQITPVSTSSKVSIASSVNSSYYEMTDEYHSETDDELEKQRAKKKIPKWVKDSKLLNDFLKNTEQLDPDFIFSPVKTCDLEEIFQTNSNNVPPQNVKRKVNREYGTRTSSCNWNKDHFTSEEEARYKQEMGYRPLQFR